MGLGNSIEEVYNCIHVLDYGTFIKTPLEGKYFFYGSTVTLLEQLFFCLKTFSRVN